MCTLPLDASRIRRTRGAACVFVKGPGLRSECVVEFNNPLLQSLKPGDGLEQPRFKSQRTGRLIGVMPEPVILAAELNLLDLVAKSFQFEVTHQAMDRRQHGLQPVLYLGSRQTLARAHPDRPTFGFCSPAFRRLGKVESQPSVPTTDVDEAASCNIPLHQ